MATKQMARELGLLRRGSSSAACPGQTLSSTSGQTFAYLLVMDFEATCWQKEKAIPSEIIEFPAVLLNTKTGQIESEFHCFLQPSERPFLSDFCQKLTGITQVQVDNGIPLSLCLKKFVSWLKKLQDDKGITCSGDYTNRAASEGAVAALVTWSDWDLGVCLLNETRRKQLRWPAFLSEWIDLRATYKAFYGCRPAGLKGALMELGIKFDGREHSGLDDARNTAQLAWQMIRDGCVMAITKNLRMNGASMTKIERLSFPPSGPTHGRVQTDRQIRKSFNGGDTTCYPGLKFPIARDKEEDTDPVDKRETACEEISAGARKGLTERHLNLLTATDKCSITSLVCPTVPISDTEFAAIKGDSLFINRAETIAIVNQDVSAGSVPVLEQRWTRVGRSQYQQHSLCPPHISEFTAPSYRPRSAVTPSYRPRSAVTPSYRPRSAVTPSYRPRSAVTPSCRPRSAVTPSCRPRSAVTPSIEPKKSISPAQTSLSDSVEKLTSRLDPTVPLNTPTTSLTKPVGFLYSGKNVTPSLCLCGRRSKRRLVHKQGPNAGRWFFTCNVTNGTKPGCAFFQWVIPSNQATKQPSNQVTKQPSNQATK